jgi:hypothetical protein
VLIYNKRNSSSTADKQICNLFFHIVHHIEFGHLIGGCKQKLCNAYFLTGHHSSHHKNSIQTRTRRVVDEHPFSSQLNNACTILTTAPKKLAQN